MEGMRAARHGPHARLACEGGRGHGSSPSVPPIVAAGSWLLSRKPWGSHSRKLARAPERCHSCACSGFQHVLHTASFYGLAVSSNLQCDCAWRQGPSRGNEPSVMSQDGTRIEWNCCPCRKRKKRQSSLSAGRHRERPREGTERRRLSSSQEDSSHQ